MTKKDYNRFSNSQEIREQGANAVLRNDVQGRSSSEFLG